MKRDMRTAKKRVRRVRDCDENDDKSYKTVDDNDDNDDDENNHNDNNDDYGNGAAAAAAADDDDDEWLSWASCGLKGSLIDTCQLMFVSLTGDICRWEEGTTRTCSFVSFQIVVMETVSSSFLSKRRRFLKSTKLI